MKAAGALLIVSALFVSIIALTGTVSAQPDQQGIAYIADGLNVQFWFNGTANNSGIERQLWSFGDGNGSYYQNPGHVYGKYGTYEVMVEVQYFNNTQELHATTLVLDGPLLDTETGTLNAGSVHVGGLFLLISCSMLFIIAYSGGHPVNRIAEKEIIMFFYGLGIVAGSYLVLFQSGGLFT